MNKANISVGLTYMCTVGEGNDEVPVTLVKVCPYGGWYGKDNTTGHSVRIATAGRLRVQCDESGNIINPGVTNNHTTVQEDTTMAKPATRVTAADRRARRAANGTSTTATAVEEAIEPTASEKLDIALSTAKVDQPKSKPAATKRAPARKPAAAKPAATVTTPSSTTNNTVKESNTMPVQTRTRKPAARRTAATVTPEPVNTITATPEDIATMAAKLAAEMVAEHLAAIAANEASPVEEEDVFGEVEEEATEVKSATRTRRTAAKPAASKPAAKVDGKLTVTLKVPENGERKNSWYFKYMGRSTTPLVTGCYISKDVIELFEDPKTKSMTVLFDQVDGKKHSILFREADNGSAFNGSIYLMRSALKGSGITEETPINVTITVKSDDEITLTVVKA